MSKGRTVRENIKLEEEHWKFLKDWAGHCLVWYK